MSERLFGSRRAANLERMKLASHYPHDGVELGAWVAHDGVCMTLVGFGPRAENDGFSSWHEVDAAAETLAVTTTATWPLASGSIWTPNSYGGNAKVFLAADARESASRKMPPSSPALVASGLIRKRPPS